MTIFISKFGAVLTSRQSGKEAYAAFLPILASVKDDEQVVVDFSGVLSFAPSWGDEFLTPLQQRFGQRLVLINTQNSSVALTIKMLESLHGEKFGQSA